MSPLLVFHIVSACIALPGGIAAMSLRKGSRAHRVGGIIFALGMLAMTLSAVPLGLWKGQTLNALVGALTCYLVVSGWLAGHYQQLQRLRMVNALLAAAVLAMGILLIRCALEALGSPTHVKDGEEAGGYFFFGGIALVSAGLDLRLIWRGISAKHRMARHLLRMNLVMAIGIISVTPRLNRLSGHAIHSDVLLLAPTGIVLLYMVFWLWRVLSSRARRRVPVAVAG